MSTTEIAQYCPLLKNRGQSCGIHIFFHDLLFGGIWAKKTNRGKNIGSCGKIFGTKKEIVEKRKLWKKFQILKNPKKANRGRALKDPRTLCSKTGGGAVQLPPQFDFRDSFISS